MKTLSNWWRCGLALLGVCGLSLVLAGCGTVSSDEPVFTDAPPLAGSSQVSSPPDGGASPGAGQLVDRFRRGDLVIVTFSGIEPPPAPHEERIKEDGTITLAMIGSVIAEGKTAGELQKEIQGRYVPKYYLRLVVTVRSLDRFYYVGGEVKGPGRQPWVGELTVTQAIQTAGDFTDFANKKKVDLVRADGSKIRVNCVEAIREPAQDPKVMPGDKIHVPRRFW